MKKGMGLLREFERWLEERYGALSLDAEEEHPEWKEFESCWDGYGPRGDMAVREGALFWHDEVSQGIMAMFYEFYRFLADKVDELGLDVFVSPSYEDSSWTLIIMGDFVVMNESRKAWNFSWETPQEMAEELVEALAFIRKRVSLGKKCKKSKETGT